MSAEHPSLVMRRAANLLREAGSTATPPPWRVSYLDGVVPVVDGADPSGHLVARMHTPCEGEAGCGERAKANATLIALLGNARESLAGWLEAEADRADRFTTTDPYGRNRWCQQCGFTLGRGCGCWGGALATALAILGEEAP